MDKNKYLTDGTEKKVVKKADLYRMIKEIKELLERGWQLAHQEVVNVSILPEKYDSLYQSRCQDKCEFIRYLQDQVNKIVEGIE